MKRILSLLIVAIFMASCSSTIELENTADASAEELLRKPFNVPENSERFKEAYPRLNDKKYLRENDHYPEKTDTIYKFSSKKSAVIFYKSFTGKEFLLSAKIEDNKVPLRYNIQPGVTKNDLIKTLREIDEIPGDTLFLKDPGMAIKFCFDKKEKLKTIEIDNYFD